MIITQTREQRSFVGSMNPGEDVVESLARICVDNSIFCAHFSGIGYLRSPRIRTYNVARKRFEEPSVHDGVFHMVAMHGNVSLQERNTIVRCHVIGTLRQGEEEPTLLSGELTGGDVLSIEFSLSTIDDLRLYRAEDDRTGLDPWLHMDLGSGPPTGADPNAELPIIETAPGAAPPEPRDQDTPAPPVEGGQAPDLLVGDYLDHPTLGTCEVLAVGDDEKVTILLESGRKVQLHIGLLALSPKGRADKGGTIYAVTIRRRR